MKLCDRQRDILRKYSELHEVLEEIYNIFSDSFLNLLNVRVKSDKFIKIVLDKKAAFEKAYAELRYICLDSTDAFPGK